jgi:glutathione synthase
MSLVVALQMDPMEGIDCTSDSSFLMGLEAQKRGHSLWHYTPMDLALRDGRLTALARPMELKKEPGQWYRMGERERLDLSMVDVILMRQDPPFDMAYVAATHLLDHLKGRVLMVNDPEGVRDAPEKLLVTHFPEVAPPTLITSSVEEIKAFRKEHKDIVVKPLFGRGGEGVFRLRPEDENFNSLMDFHKLLHREPLVIQKFLPEIREGDKRVMMIEGEIVGAFNRVPLEGNFRINFRSGRNVLKTVITDREREICHGIGATLRRLGLVFAAVDMIGGRVTEINVTSPGGIPETNAMNGICMEALLFDAIEKRLEKMSSTAAMPTGS